MKYSKLLYCNDWVQIVTCVLRHWHEITWDFCFFCSLLHWVSNPWSSPTFERNYVWLTEFSKQAMRTIMSADSLVVKTLTVKCLDLIYCERNVNYEEIQTEATQQLLWQPKNTTLTACVVNHDLRVLVTGFKLMGLGGCWKMLDGWTDNWDYKLKELYGYVCLCVGAGLPNWTREGIWLSCGMELN